MTGPKPSPVQKLSHRARPHSYPARECQDPASIQQAGNRTRVLSCSITGQGQQVLARDLEVTNPGQGDHGQGVKTPPPRCDGPIPRSSRTRTSPPQYSVFLPPPGSGQILLLELNRKLLNKLKDGAFTQGSARLNNRTRLLITRTHQ